MTSTMDSPDPHRRPGGQVVRDISRDELREELARGGDLKLVMAASVFGFRVKHIPGSLNFRTPDEMFAALGTDDNVVVYCSNADCSASLATYKKLKDHGYTNVRHYSGGLIDWEAAGLPLEGDWADGQGASS
jgi:rhodanese-related sulfurtransferase